MTLLSAMWVQTIGIKQATTDAGTDKIKIKLPNKNKTQIKIKRPNKNKTVIKIKRSNK